MDAALALTRERGLEGWTIRDLAAELNSWPNSIAHHVGDREAILYAVVGRVVEMMPNPPAELGWQDWFRALLTDGGAVIGDYVGVARRLCRDGPTVTAALPIIERGVGLLREAGFGDNAPRAYSALLNGAMLLIALGEDRLLAGHTHDQAARNLMAVAPPADSGPGWESMHAHLDRWATDPATSRKQLYSYTIETLIAGLEAELRWSLSGR